MAFEVKKVYKEHYPALRFIGKKYSNEDRVDGGFDLQWEEWSKNNWFEVLEKLGPSENVDNGNVGLMLLNESTNSFTYMIGLFFPAETIAPEGFQYLDLPESDIGIGWVCGMEENGEVFGPLPHETVCEELLENGWGNLREDIGGNEGTICFFERYNRPRYTVKDSEGRVTLDYGNYIVCS